MEVGADENAKVESLLLPLLLVPCVSLVLHSHPQLIHLGEIEENEVDAVQHGGVRGLLAISLGLSGKNLIDLIIATPRPGVLRTWVEKCALKEVNQLWH